MQVKTLIDLRTEDFGRSVNIPSGSVVITDMQPLVNDKGEQFFIVTYNNNNYLVKPLILPFAVRMDTREGKQ